MEVWTDQQHCCAVFDRDTLRGWLFTLPRRPLVVDAVVFSIDVFAPAGESQVALTLPGVVAWILSPVVLAELQNRI